MTTYSLCSKDGKCCCPEVDVQDCCVRIGEEGNLCTLNKDEWSTLVSKIKSGEIQ